jgi:hypothetical protein
MRLVKVAETSIVINCWVCINDISLESQGKMDSSAGYCMSIGLSIGELHLKCANMNDIDINR